MDRMFDHLNISYMIDNKEVLIPADNTSGKLPKAAWSKSMRRREMGGRFRQICQAYADAGPAHLHQRQNSTLFFATSWIYRPLSSLLLRHEMLTAKALCGFSKYVKEGLMIFSRAITTLQTSNASESSCVRLTLPYNSLQTVQRTTQRGGRSVYGFWCQYLLYRRL